MVDFTDLFFKLLKYYKTGELSDLDEKVIAVAESEKQNAERHFQQVVDLPAFRGYDYESVRQFLIHWYAATRTLVSLHRRLTDVYALDYDSLSEYIKSLGFIYPDYIPKRNRATFLLELVNLYKIKGSPQSLLKLVQFLDYLDFKVLEYWLVSCQTDYDLVYDTEFFFDERPPKHLLFIGKQVGRMIEDAPLQITYTYDHFRKKLADGHWYYTKREIGNLDAEEPLNLPSMTPYFGLFNDQYVTQRWLPTYAVLSRMIKQQYNEWQDGSTLPKTVLLDPFGQYVSFLEVVLALWWTFYVYYGYIDPISNELNEEKFANLVPDPLQRHICYCLDLAQNLDKTQFKEDVERLFNSVPRSREELYKLLAERKDKFTSSNNFSLLPDPRNIRIILEELNHDLFEFLQNEALTGGNLKHLINQLWEEVDNILGALDLALSTIANINVFEGEFVYAVINFFKPIYARLANLAFVLNITDRIGDSILLDDIIYFTITHNLVSKFRKSHCGYFDCPCDYFDSSEGMLVCDRLDTIFSQYFEEERFHSDDALLPLITLAADEVLERLNDNTYSLLTNDLPDGSRQQVDFFDGGGFFDKEGIIQYDALSIEEI